MSFFSSSYHEAREKFLTLADAYGLRNIRFRVPHEASPDLFLDFAFVKRNPEKLLIQISGTHGVEGYAGSAIQCSLLQEGPAAGDASLLFVHALNPYGMFFHRRANAQNVDLNRNYERNRRPNPDYECFDTFLNPKTGAQFFTGPLRGLYESKRLGESRTRQAVASGQFTHPEGLFYMGESLQREIQLLQEILRSHFPEATRAIAIDLHTGLGDPGQEQLFVDEDLDPEAPELLGRLYGREVSRMDPAAGAYIPQGRLSNALREALPGAELHTVLQEIGTYPDRKVLNALRRENYEWHRNGPVQGASEKAQAAMMEMFCPASESWRERAVQLGLQRWKQSLSFFD